MIVNKTLKNIAEQWLSFSFLERYRAIGEAKWNELRGINSCKKEILG